MFKMLQDDHEKINRMSEILEIIMESIKEPEKKEKSFIDTLFE